MTAFRTRTRLDQQYSPLSESMRLSRALCSNAAKITLFTRPNCSLCITAKQAVADVRKNRRVEYEELDVMQSGNEKWKIYEFDTPVVIEQRTPAMAC